MKVVPVTVGPVRASGVPSLDSCASTVSKNISASNIELNFTTHVKVASDPIIWIELTALLVSVRDEVGTILCMNVIVKTVT